MYHAKQTRICNKSWGGGEISKWKHCASLSLEWKIYVPRNSIVYTLFENVFLFVSFIWVDFYFSPRRCSRMKGARKIPTIKDSRYWQYSSLGRRDDIAWRQTCSKPIQCETLALLSAHPREACFFSLTTCFMNTDAMQQYRVTLFCRSNFFFLFLQWNTCGTDADWIL